MDSKQQKGASVLPTSTSGVHGDSHVQPRRSGLSFRRLCYTLSIACSVYGIFHILQARRAHPPHHGHARLGPLPPTAQSDVCPQPKSLYPTRHSDLSAGLDSTYADEAFKAKAYESLIGAIKIPYVVLAFSLLAFLRLMQCLGAQDGVVR